jgi:TonB family protein
MRFSAHLAAISLVVTLVTATSAQTQKEITNAHAIASAKTIYFEDKSGLDAVGKKALAELSKWGRFQIVQDRKKADLILVLETDPHQGGNLIYSGGQTGTIDSEGHIDEDNFPNYNKQAAVRYGFLTAMDPQTGKNLWSVSQRWGGLLTGFDSVGERLVKEFEKQTQAAERSSNLKLIKSVFPTYPQEASKKHIEGTVVVRIVVDRDGKIASARALSGPSELITASVEAAKQLQYEPPENAPVMKDLEMSYNLGPKPCPPGNKGEIANVLSAFQFPKKPLHPGELKIVGELNDPLPPYPEEARKAGKEGDLEMVVTVARSGEVVGARVTKSVDRMIDQSAIATVRTWKFKVSRGEQATFPIKFLYRMSCTPHWISE